MKDSPVIVKKSGVNIVALFLLCPQSGFQVCLMDLCLMSVRFGSHLLDL